jgi:heme-degrading monooxygenase HmoA
MIAVGARSRRSDLAIVLFRSRLAPDLPETYGARALEMLELARRMPGFRSFKQFIADDGERLALIEFDTQAQLRAWGEHPEHRKAQREGRERYYAAYHLQVCELARESRFDRKPADS